MKPEDGTAYADGLAYPKFEAANPNVEGKMIELAQRLLIAGELPDR